MQKLKNNTLQQVNQLKQNFFRKHTLGIGSCGMLGAVRARIGLKHATSAHKARVVVRVLASLRAAVDGGTQTPAARARLQKKKNNQIVRDQIDF